MNTSLSLTDQWLSGCTTPPHFTLHYHHRHHRRHRVVCPVLDVAVPTNVLQA